MWKRWFYRETEECDDPGCLQRLVDWSSNPLRDLQEAGITDAAVLARFQ